MSFWCRRVGPLWLEAIVVIYYDETHARRPLELEPQFSNVVSTAFLDGFRLARIQQPQGHHDKTV